MHLILIVKTVIARQLAISEASEHIIWLRLTATDRSGCDRQQQKKHCLALPHNRTEKAYRDRAVRLIP